LAEAMNVHQKRKNIHSQQQEQQPQSGPPSYPNQQSRSNATYHFDDASQSMYNLHIELNIIFIIINLSNVLHDEFRNCDYFLYSSNNSNLVPIQGSREYCQLGLPKTFESINSLKGFHSPLAFIVGTSFVIAVDIIFLVLRKFLF
jgi:hypothetical protein